MAGAGEHCTVLLREAVDALAVRDDGVYIDGTFGRGGHSRLILERLGESGRLIGFDKDETAVRVAREAVRYGVERTHRQGLKMERRNYRLLYDTDSLPPGKEAELHAIYAKRGVAVEWSFVLDAFQAERDQAITIDTTQI